ncbi:MAG TPA: hypothetical protein VKB53_02975 [Gammaproteobacteria bacterium]|nr:hypothetical protein [Gammaproteobacteria bacterium]
MKGRAWLNLGLVVLLTVLALIAWFKPSQPPPAKNLLTALHSGAINSVRIQRAKQPTLEFEQQNRQWNLISPMQTSGNDVRIGALLNLATKASDTHYNAAKLKLAKYGRAKPQISVTLSARRFAFGDMNPVDSRCSVSVGNTIPLISDDPVDLETADAAAYVTPKVIPSRSKINALALPNVELTRAEDGQWTSSPDKISQVKIEALIENWFEAQAYQLTAHEKPSIRY